MSQAINSTDTPAQNDVVLEIRDVEVTFEMARGRARVLDNVSLDIYRGETFGIVGESGCGKTMFGSTMMNAVKDPGVVSGEIIYHPPDGGEPVDILNVSDRRLNLIRWEEISMAYQGAQNSFNPTLSMRVHFRETFKAHNFDQEQGFDKARDLLRTLNLEPERIFESYQNELSGGEKQRVLLALSLVLDPEVVILDEPTSALDVLMQRNILSLLYDIKEEYDITLVLITHDFPIAAAFADRIGVMYAFNIVEQGQATDVLRDPDHPYMRMMAKTTLDLQTPIDDPVIIEGDTPDPINVPSGCPFHPRCPVADDRCEVEKPELSAEAGSDHEVACFYPDLATEQIPLSIADTEDTQ